MLTTRSKGTLKTSPPTYDQEHANLADSETIKRGRPINAFRAKNGIGEVRMIGRIREVLRFQAKAGPEPIEMSTFSDIGTF